MVRTDLQLTRVHAGWTRRRLAAAMTAASQPGATPESWRRLRDLAAACCETELAQRAELARASGGAAKRDAAGSVVVPAGNGGEPRRAPERAPERVARVHAASPSARDTKTEGAVNREAPVMVVSPPFRVRVASRTPVARFAWISRVLLDAGFSPQMEGDVMVIAMDRAPGGIQRSWMERLRAHPELVVTP